MHKKKKKKKKNIKFKEANNAKAMKRSRLGCKKRMSMPLLFPHLDFSPQYNAYSNIPRMFQHESFIL